MPNDLDEALGLFSRLAEAYEKEGRLPLAYFTYQFLAAIAPEEKVWACLANASKIAALQQEYPSALRLHDQAIAKAPPQGRKPLLWNLAAYILPGLGRDAEAVGVFKTLLESDPNDHRFHVRMAWSLGRLGRFAEAFEELDWRLQDPRNGARPLLEQFPQRQWTGQDLEGKRVFLHCEQGSGDFFFFARYLPNVKGHRIVCCRAHEESLVKASGLGEEVMPHVGFAKVSDIPPMDHFASMVSLPRWVTPVEPPYLKTLPVETGFDWEPYRENFKIGVVWAGASDHLADHWRSCPLRYFQVFCRPGVTLFSLQKSEPQRTWPAGKVDLLEGADFPLVDLAPYATDFNRTANLLQKLDLLISVDTSVVHLAGALGLPCWVLLPFVPDYRWGLGSETTPWYPSLRLFRQEAPGVWGGAFDRAGELLEGEAATAKLLRDRPPE